MSNERIIGAENSKTQSAFDRSEAIDALRGIAALLVVLYHARSSLWVGLKQTYVENGLNFSLVNYLGYLSAPASLGGLGVTLFFVLSGYCIHRRGARYLAESGGSQLDWKSFAVRRFWRIYPTYLVALLLTAAVDFSLQSVDGLAKVQDNSLSTFLVSLVTLQGYFAPTFGSNGVFWTLAMEMHLYTVYPILYFASKRFGPDRVVLMTFALSVVYGLLESIFGFESLLPHRFQRGPIFIPYWFTWTIGFYLAEVEAHRTKGPSNAVWKFLTLAAVPVGLLLTFKGAYLLAEIFWAIAFASLLRASLTTSGREFWGMVFGRWFARIGLFSYSLYAIHSPLLLIYHSMISPNDIGHKFDTILPALGGVIFVIPFSYLFFLVIESWSIVKATSAKSRTQSAPLPAPKN